MISFVIPAHNEQTHVGGAVAAIQAAMNDIGEVWRWVIHGPAAVKQRDGLDIWYGPRG